MKTSIIIPTLNKNEEGVRKILNSQSFTDYEFIIIKGIRPASRARNLGIKKAKGEILLFLDDDIQLVQSDILENIVKFLEKYSNAGICGVGFKSFADISKFQKRVIKEIPRMELDIPKETKETETGITGSLFGVRREIIKKADGFNEQLISGEDPELFYRVKKSGFKNYLLGNLYFYHNPPASFSALMKKFFYYGIGHYQSRHLHPEWSISVKVSNFFSALLYLIVRTLILVPHIFFGEVSFKTRKFKLSFKPLRALSSYASALGFFWGFVRHRVK